MQVQSVSRPMRVDEEYWTTEDLTPRQLRAVLGTGSASKDIIGSASKDIIGSASRDIIGTASKDIIGAASKDIIAARPPAMHA